MAMVSRRSAALLASGAALVLWTAAHLPAGGARAEGVATEGARVEGATNFLERARDAAANDRHREAIDLYLRAVAQDSLLVATVSVELGHQYTWAEIPDSAILWYGVYLRSHPDDIEARIGIARALSWSDRLTEAESYYAEILADTGERRNEVMLGLAKTNAWQEDYGAAERIYREALALDSTDVDARTGLAETLNWCGKHREAAGVWKALLAEEPRNADAAQGLARADLWRGRPDLAIRTIETSFANGVQSDDLDRLADGIRAMRRPTGDTGFSYRENTDDGLIRTWRTTAAVPIDYLTEVTGAYAKSVLHKLGYPDIDRDGFSLGGRRRFSDKFAATATVGYQWNDFDAVAPGPGDEAVDDFDLFVWDVYATLFPRDWFRVDAGTSREAMDIPLPVFKRIHVTTENIGLDWRVTHRLATFWEAKYSAYSDGNSRAAAVERLEWMSPWRVPAPGRNRVLLLQGVEYSRFAKQPDNGYFSPRSYMYAYGGARFTGDIGRRATLTVDGRIGGEKEYGNDWASVGAIEIALRTRVAEGWSLAAGYFHSGSRLDSPDGFRAEGVYVTLEYGGAP